MYVKMLNNITALRSFFGLIVHEILKQVHLRITPCFSTITTKTFYRDRKLRAKTLDDAQFHRCSLIFVVLLSPFQYAFDQIVGR